MAWPFRLGTSENVTVNSTSAQSSAIPTGYFAVRLVPTVGMHVRIGSSPTAVTTDAKLVAGDEYYFTAYPGEKVAAIRTTTSGTLNVVPVT